MKEQFQLLKDSISLTKKTGGKIVTACFLYR